MSKLFINLTGVALTLCASAVFAEENQISRESKISQESSVSIERNKAQVQEQRELQESEVQDMSDPMAVYSQAGFGSTNRGINLKYGNAYDTGNPETMGMDVFEIKGLLGDSLGWEDDAQQAFDSIRYRNFDLNLTNGRGAQIDVIHNNQFGVTAASYSFMQALPKWGRLQLFPLVGAGAMTLDTTKHDEIDNIGHMIAGAYGVVGLYSKLEITDKIWLNYNPMYLTGLTGQLNGEDAIAHEVITSYQLTPRQNIRLFMNWSDKNSFNDRRTVRLEFNQQF